MCRVDPLIHTIQLVAPGHTWKSVHIHEKKIKTNCTHRVRGGVFSYIPMYVVALPLLFVVVIVVVQPHYHFILSSIYATRILQYQHLSTDFHIIKFYSVITILYLLYRMLIMYFNDTDDNVLSCVKGAILKSIQNFGFRHLLIKTEEIQRKPTRKVTIMKNERMKLKPFMLNV